MGQSSVITEFEKLPKTKSKNGYAYCQIKRNDKVALYEQRVEKEINGEVGTIVGYEVFLITVGKPYSLVQKHGKKKGEVYNYPAAEKFPGNESFGDWAFAYCSKDAALAKFNELSNS